MKQFATRTLGLLLLVAVGFGRPLAVRAGEDDPNADLKRKSEEVEKLKHELDQKQRELEQLRKENQRLRREKAPAPAAAARPARPAPPVTPMDNLPPLAKTDIVEIHNLVGHFLANPEAAAARYTKQQFCVKGDVVRFNPRLVVSNYEVILESPDNAVNVICSFNYVDKYAAVFTKQHGQTLVARTSAGSEIPLLKIGDPVIIQGWCKGLKNGEIVLTGCRLEP